MRVKVAGGEKLIVKAREEEQLKKLSEEMRFDCVLRIQKDI